MLKFLAFLWTITSLLRGDYDIQIGVFSNAKNLHQNIQKIKVAKYRRAIKVQKKKDLHYVHAVIRGNGSIVKQALDTYRVVFPDAFIAKKLPTLHPTIKHTAKLKPRPLVKKSIVKQIIQAKVVWDAKKLIFGKSVYVCYEDAPLGFSQRLVEMHFEDKVIHYASLGKQGTLKIPYTIAEDSIGLNLFDIEMKHKIVADKGEYLLVESYVKDKKMYTLRYYKTKEKALGYLSKL